MKLNPGTPLAENVPFCQISSSVICFCENREIGKRKKRIYLINSVFAF
jgi:ribosomal protein L36